MNTDHRPYRVLFLCTGNSARSIFAEYFLRRLGGDRFESYSAGAAPSGVVNPLTIQVLRERFHIDASDARSKPWEELRSVTFDFVITLCDNARETCPVFFNAAQRLHHDFEDPAACQGGEAERLEVFRRVRDELRQYLRDFAAGEVRVS